MTDSGLTDSRPGGDGMKTNHGDGIFAIAVVQYYI